MRIDQYGCDRHEQPLRGERRITVWGESPAKRIRDCGQGQY